MSRGGFVRGGLCPYPVYKIMNDLVDIPADTYLTPATTRRAVPVGRPYPGAVTVAELVYCPMKS